MSAWRVGRDPLAGDDVTGALLLLPAGVVAFALAIAALRGRPAAAGCATALRCWSCTARAAGAAAPCRMLARAGYSMLLYDARGRGGERGRSRGHGLDVAAPT